MTKELTVRRLVVEPHAGLTGVTHGIEFIPFFEYVGTQVIGSLKKYLNPAKFSKPSQRILTPLAAQALNEFDVDAAIAAHQNWKYRLQAYLKGQSNEDFSPEVICFDDRCDLGRWLHGPGKAHLGHYPGFTALMGHHKMFHYAASNVVALYKADKLMHSHQILNGQYAAYSKALVQDLDRMRHAVKRVKKSSV